MQTPYDTIVIGSGIGGLTTAATLSKAYKKKVLVLEKHWTTGGLTHEFERQRKYSWDVGVHYIGSMVDGQIAKAVFDYISDGQLEWDKIEDPFDIFNYPDFNFEVSSDKKKYQQDLIAAFPEEAKAIKQYFKDVKKAANWGIARYLAIALPKPLAAVSSAFSRIQENFFLQTVEEYFSNRIKDPKLKALLCSQWGDYGLAPKEAIFWVHAAVVSHYFFGGFYPKGGAKSIAATIVPVIERAGGACLSKCEVTEIIVENNKAVGVKYLQQIGRRKEEKTVYAKQIVSAAGAKNTFHRFLKEPLFPALHSLKKATTAVTVYLGLKENPGLKYGEKGGNHWVFSSYDHNAMATDSNLLSEGPPKGFFLSFPSLKCQSKQSHTAEIVAFTSYEAFAEWHGTEWQDRGAAYEKMKQKIAQKFIDELDKRFAGFSDIIDFVEVSTPLSLEAFIGSPQGAMYGLPSNKARYTMDFLQPTTPIKNLYLAGGDVFMLGVCGALLGSFATAARMGSSFGLLSLFPKMMVNLRTVSK